MATGTSPLDAALWLKRGAAGAGWQLQSTREEWATRLLRGWSGDDLPRLLPSLYSVCGGAHRLVATLALAAARGEPPRPPSADEESALRLDTLREHLRRLWLDAPRLAAAGAAVAAAHAAQGPDPSELARCPFITGQGLGPVEQQAIGRHWIEQHVLDQDADAWLAAWRMAAAGFGAQWAASSPTWPARWLAAMRHLLGEGAAPPCALRAAASPAALQSLARALRDEPGFALAPTSGGLPAETGCWTRLADPLARAEVYAPFWMRHAARIAEIARLSSTAEGAGGLAMGALPTGEREGLGWCEMARGLLVHWLQLDRHDRIVEVHVLAPTEWNFHPQGAAANALLAIAARTTTGRASDPRVTAGVAAPNHLDVAQIRALAAAYDPCVDLRIDPVQSLTLAQGADVLERDPIAPIANEAPHA